MAIREYLFIFKMLVQLLFFAFCFSSLISRFVSFKAIHNKRKCGACRF